MSQQVNQTVIENEKIRDKTILEDHNPVHILGKETLGKDWPLEGADYLTIVRAGICSIPVIGAIADAGFSIIWGKIFPTQDDHVTKEEFNKKMKQLVQDMEKKINQAIDQEFYKWCDAKFQALCTHGDEFRKAEMICMDFLKERKPVDQKSQMFFTAQYVNFGSALRECLEFFSRPDKVHLTIKVYLQTSLFYIALLRDSYIFREKWGLPEKYINGTVDGRVKPLKDYIHHKIIDITNVYATYVKSSGRRDFEDLINQFLFADPVLYDRKQGWMKKTNPIETEKEKGSTDRAASYIFLPSETDPYIASAGATEFIVYGGGYIEEKDRIEFTTGTKAFHHMDFVDGNPKQASWFSTFIGPNKRESYKIRAYWVHPQGLFEKPVDAVREKAPSLIGKAVGGVVNTVAKVNEKTGEMFGGHAPVSLLIRKMGVRMEKPGYQFYETQHSNWGDKYPKMTSTIPQYGSNNGVKKIVMSESEEFTTDDTNCFVAMISIPVEKCSLLMMEVIAGKEVKKSA